MRKMHQLFVGPEDRITIRARDGRTGRVLGVVAPAAGGLQIVQRPCPACQGRCLVELAEPIKDAFGPGKRATHEACKACRGTGLGAA